METPQVQQFRLARQDIDYTNKGRDIRGIGSTVNGISEEIDEVFAQ